MVNHRLPMFCDQRVGPIVTHEYREIPLCSCSGTAFRRLPSNSWSRASIYPPEARFVCSQKGTTSSLGEHTPLAHGSPAQCILATVFPIDARCTHGCARVHLYRIPRMSSSVHGTGNNRISPPRLASQQRKTSASE
ncbi:hypothetical protein C8Q80DRAFT_1152039 [Daedaleopsis nitida]|nr:hypothetical protein C8Q80DRAFT_1152039 [Daedaleopsis nitida]